MIVRFNLYVFKCLSTMCSCLRLKFLGYQIILALLGPNLKKSHTKLTHEFTRYWYKIRQNREEKMFKSWGIISAKKSREGINEQPTDRSTSKFEQCGKFVGLFLQN